MQDVFVKNFIFKKVVTKVDISNIVKMVYVYEVNCIYRITIFVMNNAAMIVYIMFL